MLETVDADRFPYGPLALVQLVRGAEDDPRVRAAARRTLERELGDSLELYQALVVDGGF